MPNQPERTPAVLERPAAEVSDPRELLLESLEWYRNALMRKIAGLSDAQLRTPVEPMGWSPLGMVNHLGWVERRWMRWGFAAEDLPVYPHGDDDTEWSVPAERSIDSVVAAYFDEVERSRALVRGVDLAARATVGGRFTSPDEAPSLGRIVVHLLQEYARHVGQLDVVRELIDGETGE